MDTQVNESFNNTVSWVAPKNKVYCGSCSLSNRISIAVGVNSLGIARYFTRLFKSMGIQLTPSITHYLEVKDKARLRRIAKSKLTGTKKERVQKRNDTMKVDEAQARKERAKRDGTYKRGQNMDEGGADGYTEEELLQIAATNPGATEEELQGLLQTAATKPAKKRRKVNADVICKHCGVKGHTTTRSKACKKNKDYMQKPEETPESVACGIDVAAAYKDMDDMDNSPLLPDDASTDESISEFFDTGTWSDDESDHQQDII
jgi:hypothetical protein